jgi:glucan endo-1,3-beta-D-glucosidase
MILAILVLLLQLLPPALPYNVHTGFNYGAVWGSPDKPKRKDEYIQAFTTAYNLNTSVAFDSARLFTCRQPNTADAWIEAFDAAVATHTYLLLGFYLSETKNSAQQPGQAYESNADMLKHELRALEKALGHFGSDLADLIIGLSFGNEDMEQCNSNGVTTGVPAYVIAGNIATVRDALLGSALNEQFPNIMKYMTGKPSGHTDTAPYATKINSVEFVGMNAYPYWSRDPPTSAKASYFGSLSGVKNAMPGKEIWLTEVGWPFSDTVSHVSSRVNANKQNLQRFWNEIGCDVFGKYTTFWFELIQDTLPDQPDWYVNKLLPFHETGCAIHIQQ